MNLLRFFPSVFLFTLCIIISASGQTLNNPESITYDTATHKYYISNTKASNILCLDSAGKYSVFFNGAGIMSTPKGLMIVKRMLYVADGANLFGIDLDNGSLVVQESFPNAENLNDICYDNIDTLFISDMDGNAIFEYDLTNQDIRVLPIKAQTLNKPNGLYYDQVNEKLIVLSFINNAPIVTIDKKTLKMDTIAKPNLSLLDGIASDGMGHYYISSWGGTDPGMGAVYKFNSDFSGTPVKFLSNLSGPADIFYDTTNMVLAVPCMSSSKIMLVDLKPPEPPQQLSPTDKSVDIPLLAVFKWQRLPGLDYVIQLSKNEDFSTKSEFQIQSSTNYLDSFKLYEKLDSNTYYFWRIMSKKEYVSGDWSAAWMFKTIAGGTGIYDIKNLAGIRVSPNPANDYTAISFNDEDIPDDVTITLYNSMGEKQDVLYFTNPGTGIIKLETGSLANGVWMMEIKSGNSVIIKKLVIIR